MFGSKLLPAAAIVLGFTGQAFITAQVKTFKPVTEEMLLNPDPGDWMNWRRTLDAWGYSPLKQINKQNVISNLRGHGVSDRATLSQRPGI